MRALFGFLNILCLFLLFSGPRAHAQQSPEPMPDWRPMWFSNAPLNAPPPSESAETVCRGVVEGVAGVYYNGAFFKDIIEHVPAPGQVWTLCRDTYDETHQIEQFCVIDENNNGIFDAGDTKLGMPCTPPGPCNPCGVGNPTMAPQGIKIETAIDWVSPKDSRLRIRRTYRSDGGLSSAYAHRGVYSHQGVWMSDFDEMVIFNRYYPDGATTYYRRDGVPIPFNGAPFGQVAYPVYGGSPYTLVNSPGFFHTMTDPSGVRYVFRGTFDSATWHTLEDIVWPDGYKISVSRVPSDMTKIDTITDNRGQRLKYVWTSAPTPSTTADVVDRIDIDVNFNGTAFSPDYAIDYDYLDNPNKAFKVMIGQVDRITYATGQSEVIAKYDYDVSNKTLSVPLLTATYDGRRDAQGQLIPYGTFTYMLDARRLPVVTESKHPGGADGYVFDYLPVGASPTTMIASSATGADKTYSGVQTSGGLQVGQISVAAGRGILASSLTLDYNPTGLGAPGYVYGRTERNGSQTLFERDARGLVTKKTEDATGASPRVTTYTWHSTFRFPLTRVTSDLAESFAYSPDGLLTVYTQTDNKSGSPTFGQSRTWTYTYTTLASGLKVMTSVDGPGTTAQSFNDVTSYAYDTEGKLTSVTDANGLVTTISAFNTSGQPAQVNNPDGTSWTFTYDDRGRIASSRFGPTGSTPPASTYSYDVIGQLVSYTNTRGKTWTFTYDDARRLILATNPSGDKATYTHDLNGNINRTEYSNGANPATFWEDTDFDGLSRLMRTTDAGGRAWNYRHDVEDNLTTITDPDAVVTTNGYDPLNRIISVTDREGYQTAMSYNDSDLRLTYTDPRSLTTSFTYNGFGDILTEVSPDRGTITYTYNSLGLAASMKDGKNQTTLYTYDHGGRVTKIDYAGGAARDVTFTYDIRSNGANTINAMKGKLSRVITNGVRTDFGYTAGALTDEYLLRDYYPGNRNYATFETRDKEGNLTRLKYPNGDYVDYTYDNDNRIILIKYKFAAIATPVTIVDQITWRPNGPLATMRFGDGYTQTRTYDTSYRLTGLADANATVTLRSLAYGYDNRDNLTSASDLLAPANSETFTYTPRDSLSGASGPYGSYGFTYDGVGNRVSHTTPSGVEAYAYPPTSNRLASVTSSAPARAFTYDANGSVISDTRGATAYAYAYDTAGRLASVSLNGVVQASYTYDWKGQQAVRRFPASGVAIQSVFDSAGHRIAEYSEGTGALIRAYVWMGDMPVAVVEGGQVYYVRVDHIGRPAFATTSAGTVVWSASYLPFGGVHVTTGAPIDLRFPGQWFQTEAGLYQNWMRDYDPTLGRYVEADPLGLVDGASVYGYVRGNPGRWVDPRGENHLNPSGQANCDLFRVTGIWGGAPSWCNEPKPELVCTSDDDDRCEENYEIDTNTCNGISRMRGKQAGARCHASAAERFAACRAGLPIPPLNTWNN